MTALEHLKVCELRHNDAPIARVRAHGVEWLSDALNDDAVFWFGRRALERQVRETRKVTLRGSPPWFLEALKRSASSAASSNSRG